MNFCCRRIGSSAASSSSAMFSSTTHFPNRMPFSSVRRKFLSLSFVTSMPWMLKSLSLPMALM